MIRTLQFYLGKDLLKAALPSWAVLTLVMTVLAIIEPLREQGLSSGQALRMFGYLMPAMLSLTLPIAALFATTFVYGRFAQDSELMASRASGIRALSLLAPAAWLGLAVTLVTLTLSLYVAPRLLWRSQNSVRADLKDIAYHRLRTQGHARLGSQLVHVDRVDPESDWVAGVVAIDVANPDDARVLVASQAKVDDVVREGRTLLRFVPVKWAAFTQTSGSVLMADEQLLEWFEVPDIIKDDPKLYDWDRLCRTLSSPRDNALVQQGVLKIRRQIGVQTFYRDLMRALEKTGSYELAELIPSGTEIRPRRVVLNATHARLSDDAAEVLIGSPDKQASRPSEPTGPVIALREFSGDNLRRTLWPRGLRVRAAWAGPWQPPSVSLLPVDVDVQDAGTDGYRHQDSPLLPTWTLPREFVESAESVDVNDLYDNPAKYEGIPRIKGMLQSLQKDAVSLLLLKVQAEMHQRLAYGLSCMLMVMLGAALGIWFRGGQVLTAFAISAIPASIVIILLLMGRQMITNPGVPTIKGILAIWGGVAGLLAATVYIYAFPMRR